MYVYLLCICIYPYYVYTYMQYWNDILFTYFVCALLRNKITEYNTCILIFFLNILSFRLNHADAYNYDSLIVPAVMYSTAYLNHTVFI